MNKPPDQPTLRLGELQVAASLRTRKRLFGRRPKSIPTVVLTVTGHSTEFDAQQVAELANGPILAEAVSAEPEGDYFLVSPAVVDANSAVGASLKNQQFAADSLLLLHGETILAELTAAQQVDLIAWLEHTMRAH